MRTLFFLHTFDGGEAIVLYVKNFQSFDNWWHLLIRNQFHSSVLKRCSICSKKVVLPMMSLLTDIADGGGVHTNTDTCWQGGSQKWLKLCWRHTGVVPYRKKCFRNAFNDVKRILQQTCFLPIIIPTPQTDQPSLQCPCLCMLLCLDFWMCVSPYPPDVGFSAPPLPTVCVGL